MNLREAILFAQQKFKNKGIASASLDAEVLLLEAINREQKNKKDKSWMYLNFEKYNLRENEEKLFREFIKRREKNEPIAYLVQNKEFYGLDFFVNKSTLIPRPETELIVEKVLQILKDIKEQFTILDIGTGSGCIIISIVKKAEEMNLNKNIKKAFANDISKEAIKIAKTNARKNKLASKIIFLESDLEKALAKIKNSNDIIITANLPYICTEDYLKLKSNVKKFEPKIALTTKENGLYHIRRLIENFAVFSQNFNSFYILLEAEPKQMKSIEKLAKKEIKGAKIDFIYDLHKRKRTAVIWKK